MKQCPRCNSARIQRGYTDAPLVLRLVGLRGLLCNNCGLEFKGFDFSGGADRAASTKKEVVQNRRRAPRYRLTLPASISLVEVNSRTGNVWESQAARGRCVALNKYGLAVSFVGTRFEEEDFSSVGRLLYIRLMLPKGPVDMVVTTVTHDRVREGRAKSGWLIGASITKMSDDDRARLNTYLESRARDELSPGPLS